MLRGFRIFAIAAALLVAMGARHVYAKGPSYVITGGQLGPYAASVSAAYSDNWDGSLPGDRARRVDPPAQAPPLVYDIFTSSGNFAVPYQMANGGPEFRYVPSLGLLEDRRVDTHAGAWYELAPEQRSFLDRSIAEALQQKAEGKLERGPIAADFRARHLPEMSYWLRPALIVTKPGYMSLDSCADQANCFPLGREDPRRGRPSSEAFVMRDLIATISHHLERPQRAYRPTP